MTVKRQVTVSYRYSAQVDPSDRNSPWASAEVGFSVESEAIEDPDVLAAQLGKDAKVQVFTQLGVEFDEDLNPIAVVAAPPIGETKKRAAQRTTKNAATLDVSTLPRVEVDGVVFVDYRTAKNEKLVNPKFPDFKSEDNKVSHWLTDTQGQPTDFADKVAALTA